MWHHFNREGLELAQKIEREDNDADLAAKLGAEDAIRYLFAEVSVMNIVYYVFIDIFIYKVYNTLFYVFRYRKDCIERAALAAADELVAKSIQDEQNQVTLQRRESLKVVADADAVIARELQVCVVMLLFLCFDRLMCANVSIFLVSDRRGCA